MIYALHVTWGSSVALISSNAPYNYASQAVPVVYLPVWVDDYAPEGQVTRWMSYTQLAGIGGT